MYSVKACDVKDLLLPNCVAHRQALPRLRSGSVPETLAGISRFSSGLSINPRLLRIVLAQFFFRKLQFFCYDKLAVFIGGIGDQHKKILIGVVHLLNFRNA